MKDLMKRTKADLVTTIHNLKSTVEARDKRINELLEKENSELNNLKAVITMKDKEMQLLKNSNSVEVKKWKEYAESHNSKADRDINLKVEQYKRAYEKRTAELNMYYNQHGNLLKTLSGTINMALELNENMEKEVTSNGSTKS